MGGDQTLSDDAFKARVGRNPRGSPPFGDRTVLDLFDVGGEVDGAALEMALPIPNALTGAPRSLNREIRAESIPPETTIRISSNPA